ncbi:fatty acyl-CoA synthetase [Euzebya tangerina]|uniref:fatty acyl-CoA synthetase n=1 Tax=Euzebya tangerina TaxID=591198 RepID=UPI000E31C4AA|nr:fatty acyl-CoA synthetase [Euzebya tangerina]
MPPDVTRLVASARSHGIAQSIRRTAEVHGEDVAIRFAERTWTYAQLVAAVDALAAAWQQAGLEPGDKVAFLGRNSDRYAIAWLATQAAGLIHVPINFMLSATEVAYVLGHSGAAIAYADLQLAHTLKEAARLTDQDVALGLIDGDVESDGVVSLPAALTGDGVPCAVDGQQPVGQIAYTSGTESRPKGAMLAVEGQMDQYWACIVECHFERTDRVLHALPLYHCAQTHCFLTPYLMLGATNLVLDGADPGVLLDTIEAEGISSLFCPPTVWIELLRHPDFDPSRMATVTKGYYGASIMPVEVVRELSELLPGLRLWNLYGQTELGPLATVLQPEDQLRKAGSAGTPVLTVQTRVVDEAMADVAVGEIGEIVHRSRQVTLGYLDDPERTAAAFEGGWFHSGDLATMDADGYITVVDRKKDMINSGGENVSSREVEEALYAHPAIAEAAVIGVPDDKWIEAVTAVVVPRDGATVDVEEVLRFVGENGLARFKQPKSIHVADELPKNPSGKILKRELRERIGSG